MPITKKAGLTAVFGVGTVAVICAVLFLTTRNSQDDQPLTAAQKAQRLLERMPVIDGHNDFPWNLRKFTFNNLNKVNFSDDLSKIEPWASSSDSYTDIPRLRQGHVGGQFWVAYTACTSNYKDSVSQTLEQIDVIKRLAAAYPNDLHFATSSADIESAIQQGKIASLIAIEGGHSIQSSFAILRLMYDMGARYMTLTHNCNLPWVDAAPVDHATNPIEPVNNGLSQFGLNMIDEMNRVGMMVDLSHVSMATMKAALARSRAPVIFSHSSAKAICNHHRNVPDDVLLLVKANKGIVMVNFYRHFVQCDSTKNATISDVILHIEHIRSVAGVDHIGIGADYDGVDEVPIDLPDVSSYPKLFEALLETGNWTEEELEKLAGRNLIRVFKQVEKVRDDLASLNTQMQQDVITRSDIERAKINTTCVSNTFIDDDVLPNKTDDGANMVMNDTIIEDNTDDEDTNKRTRRHALSYEESGDL